MKTTKMLFTLLLCVFVAMVSYADKKKGYKKGFHEFTFPNNCVYTGEWLQYKPFGQGTMKLANGTVYVGTFGEDGLPTGSGIVQWPNGDKIEIKQETYRNYAIIRYANGDVYKGSVNYSVMQDVQNMFSFDISPKEGELTKAKTGDTYTGTFEKRKMTSYGIIKYGNGDVFEGIVNYNVKQDNQNMSSFDISPKLGELTRAETGATYTGNFEKGKMIYGTISYKNGEALKIEKRDGSVYKTTTKKYGNGYLEETFKDGVKFGDIRYRDSQIDFKGTMSMQDGIFVGQGTIKEKKFSTTVTYEGHIVDYKLEGNGVSTQESGGRAEGKWKEGKIISGTVKDYRLNDSVQYTGTIVDGKVNGEGSSYQYSGSEKRAGGKYIGGFRNGKEDGEGTRTWPNGDKYVGQFKDGKYHGQGTYTWGSGANKGDKYVGQHKDGHANGQGTYYYANGDKYVGQWKDDHFNGQGTYYYANGAKYVGQWKDNKENGQGTYTSPIGRIKKQTGLWYNGHHVSGTLVKTNGTFVGRWDEDGNYLGR